MGGGESFDFEFFWGREGVPGRWRQRPGMDWPSGLGGVGGRGRASTHGAFSWVGGCLSSGLNPTKKMILSFFGAGMGGSLVGGDRVGSWGGGRGVEGSGGGSGGIGVRVGGNPPILGFFGAGRGGSLVGGDRGQGWTGLRAWEE